MMRSRAAISALTTGLGLWVMACAPVDAPHPIAPYQVTETVVSPGGAASAPAILVQALAADPLTRDDWAVAEAQALSHCTGQGDDFVLLPATTTHTQVQYDEGVWTFIARCE